MAGKETRLGVGGSKTRREEEEDEGTNDGRRPWSVRQEFVRRVGGFGYSRSEKGSKAEKRGYVEEGRLEEEKARGNSQACVGEVPSCHLDLARPRT